MIYRAPGKGEDDNRDSFRRQRGRVVLGANVVIRRSRVQGLHQATKEAFVSR